MICSPLINTECCKQCPFLAHSRLWRIRWRLCARSGHYRCNSCSNDGVCSQRRKPTIGCRIFSNIHNQLFQPNLCNDIIRLENVRVKMDKTSKNQIVDSDIARLLLKHRKARNLTVTELAQRSGVSQAMISFAADTGGRSRYRPRYLTPRVFFAKCTFQRRPHCAGK